MKEGLLFTKQVVNSRNKHVRVIGISKQSISESRNIKHGCNMD